MPQNNPGFCGFINLNTVDIFNDEVITSPYLHDGKAFYYGLNQSNGKRIIIVTPRTHDELLNPLSDSYEDVEMSMP